MSGGDNSYFTADNLEIVLFSIAYHSRCTRSQRWFKLSTLIPSKRLFKISQTFSIGERSGDCAGQHGTDEQEHHHVEKLLYRCTFEEDQLIKFIDIR